MAITLLLGDLSIDFNKFLDKKLPRTQVQPLPGLTHSLYGTGCGTGSLYAPKCLWTINAILTNCGNSNDERTLNIIYAEFDRLRRNLATTDLLLIDTNQEIQELTLDLKHNVAPPPNDTVTEIGDYSSFFAQFDVWFTQPPEYNQEGNYRTVNLTLMEI